jgi:hypothetical protein
MEFLLSQGVSGRRPDVAQALRDVLTEKAGDFGVIQGHILQTFF